MTGPEADEAGSVLPSRQLRDVLGSFATGVAVVTTRAADGQPVGITVNSFASVSLDPPLVLWSAQRGVWPFDVFATASHYAVHVLAADQRDLSDRFAGIDPDRFDGIAHQWGVGDLPLLEGCAARLQCRVQARHAGGDHLVLVGRVLVAEHRAGCAPLVFHGGRYRGLSAD